MSPCLHESKGLIASVAGRATSPILGIETVHNLFQPTLSDAGAKSLNLFLNGTDYQWSTALSVNTTDWPGRRRKGSGWCKCNFVPVTRRLVLITK